MGENSGLCGKKNDEKPFPYEKFRPKSTFNPRNKDTVIETYLSSLEERLLDIDISSKRFNNLTKEERNALYNLRDDPTIIIKGNDNSSVEVVWDREDYLKASKRIKRSMRKFKMIVASLSTPSCVPYKISKYEVISLMIHSISYWSKILNLLGLTFYLRFINVYIMLLADPLFQVVDSIQKICPDF